ncbi:MAG: helix-turn-helix transcriptional regulator [Chloroflexia bacterium]|nr:helix-turn-helix transcriptional regulator [Chloroflexia bacterium]
MTATISGITSASGNALPAPGQTLGDHLRFWRERRRMSQLALATEAEISARHLSFLETGRSRASREMVRHLAERLDVPLRARNTLLIAAGFSPDYPERTLDDPELRGARRAVDLILTGHEPFPALAIDRHWTLVASNAVGTRLFGALDVAPALLDPPLNVMRLVLHPDGMGRQIVNLSQLRRHSLERLRSQVEVSADPVLADLLDELTGYPAGASAGPHRGIADEYGGVAVPFVVRIGDDTLSFISTTTVFGSPVDITLSELAIETFFPLDTATGEALRRIAEQ